MKKYVLIGITFIQCLSTFSQVTIGSSIKPSNGAILELKEHEPDENNVTASGGFLLPRVQILEKTNLKAFMPLSTPEDTKRLIGLQVYNVGSDNMQAGTMVWSGDEWVHYVNDDTHYEASNGLSLSGENYVLGGNLTQPTMITSTKTNDNLEFHGDSIGGNLLVTGAAKLGVGTAVPSQTLDVDGTMRLSKGPNNINETRTVDNSYRALMVDVDNGQVKYSPRGSTRIAGGYRPGSQLLLAKVSPDNTILRVSFVCHVDYSDDKNNSDGSSYTYGDFVILGRGKANPIKFIEVNVKDYQGNPKTLSTKNDTILEWENRNQEKFRIVIDQEKGTLSVENELYTLSYMFELFGGM